MSVNGSREDFQFAKTDTYRSINSERSLHDSSRDLSIAAGMLGSQKYDIPQELQHDKVLGEKTIGYPGSIVYIINNISGPGMLAIPFCLQQAGWLLPMLCLFMIYIVSSLASTMMAEAMALIPGNHDFGQRVEYATLVKHFFGKRAYFGMQVLYNVSLVTLNIASILVTAQVMDLFIVFVFGKTFAIEIAPSPAFHSWESTSEVPFYQEGFLVITLGYVVSTIIFMPMGFMNLDDNIWIQFISFAVLVSILGEFVIEFIFQGLHTGSIPVIGDLSSALGTVMFAYTYVVTVPSWCNEKKPNVSVNVCIWTGSTISTMFYVVLGVLGAWAYPNMTDSNILNVMSDDPNTGDLTRFCTYVFALGVIGLGIPLFSIVVRYNLFVGGVCRKQLAIFWGTIFPYLICWFFYQGKGFQIFLNVSSLLINGFINFVIPVLVYLKAKHIQWHVKKVLEQTNVMGIQQRDTMSERDEGALPFYPPLAPPAPAEKAAQVLALPSFIDQNLYIVLGICLFISLFTSYLIVLNIVVDLYHILLNL